MKINIFYFTGTGFTERVGKGLTEEFLNLGHEAGFYYIPEVIDAAGMKGLDDSDMIGIMYPVHSFNAPEIVVDFARKLPEGKGRKAFIVKTAGDKSKINSGSSILLERVLIKRGYCVTYEELVQMPTNFMIRYEDEFILQLVRKADELVKIIAEEIVKGRRKNIDSRIRKRLFSSVARLEWLGAHTISKYSYQVADSCNLCGICITKCPTHNILIKENRISFGKKCTFCMRCIYDCPKKAIHIKRPLSFIEVNNWFDLNGMLKNQDAQ